MVIIFIWMVMIKVTINSILIYRCTLVLFIVCQAAIGSGPMFISDRVGKGSFIDMTFLVDSSPKFRVFSIGIRGYQGCTLVLLLGLSGLTMLAMLVGLVNGGILLLVIVSLMWEMPGLIRGHRGQGAGIMGHINRFFHHSRIGTPIMGVAIGWGWPTKHGLSIGWHSIEGVARGWH